MAGAAMTFGVLGRYLADRFARTVLGVFAAVIGLIFTLDFVDTLRRAGETKGASGALIAWLAVLHTPIVAEQALPFVVLVGAMTAFLTLSRRLELAVARSAGISVWQFLAPALAVSLALGIIEVAAFNPLSTAMKRHAAGLEAKLFGSGARDAGGFWLRQKTDDGQSIVHVDGRDLEKGEFLGIEVYNFDRDGAFDERVDAKSGVLRDGYWELRDAEVVTPGDNDSHANRYLLATSLTPAEIAESFVPPDTVSFFELGALASEVRSAGLDATPYVLRREQLLALPVSLVAMTLVAACFSLRLFRMGGVQRMVLGGVTAGFVLYVASKIIGDLGNAGVVSAPFAAWSPAVGGCLFGVYVLLHQEDG
jgi:lipopolysaccharide export system permease protein